ncbi:hypothetical protein V1639_10670 [Pseudarthrobacter sp. J75]|uniref:hypothetical protein n=1 Tax=unclassified Pseudarthrobacter TaxID=2647000 RepID=UPI002E804F8B|nr:MULTISPECIES: hypothetical protein [unclassified Pseudarthrobacter]MEE2522624.1 hypothetical protein [Pseudarthrobacter sp. J47]MEE2529485.1 hypothetical protein [Pseudarthrobacter sp. J75]
MSDPVYSLSWPRTLFVWEAHRILQSASETELLPWTQHLLREAFEDEGVAEEFAAKMASQRDAATWGVPAPTVNPVRPWLQALLTDEARLAPYQPPVYFAERHSGGHIDLEPDSRYTFAEDFIDLVNTMSSKGYFPKILPKICEDDNWTEPMDVTREIRRATKQAVDWPLSPMDAKHLPDVTVYSLVEYFNDQAQRPRKSEWHNWNNCGFDYSDFNRESGGAVYRWRVNTLLSQHKAPLMLGSVGKERGRLVHSFSREQDALLTQEVENRAENRADEVAHAIRMFRARNANNIDKRAALALLYKRLEPQRKYLESKTTKGDVDDIFNIANRYHIRHSVGKQFSEEREEYLEWMFWNFFSMVRLLDALEAKQNTVEKTA